jgi:hypothetical protein
VEDEYSLVVEIERSKELIELQKQLLEEYASTNIPPDVVGQAEKNHQQRRLERLERSNRKLSNLIGGESQTSSTFDTTADEWHESDGLFGASVLFSVEAIRDDELLTVAKARE